MRTWLLAPDGVWTEVTSRLPRHDDGPADWPWPEIVASVGAPVVFEECAVVDRDHLGQTHGQFRDRWIAQRVWDVLCSPRITHVTVVHVTPHSQSLWFSALAEYTGRAGEPHYHWRDRRGRWLLWAHSDAEMTPPLDGARIIVDAPRSA